MIKPQEETQIYTLSVAEKLFENSNKINTGKNRPIFGKGKAKGKILSLNQSVHAFLIRTVNRP